MSYDAETVSRAVLVHLQTAFTAAKAAIVAQWAEVAPVAIPDPVTWFYGHNPVVIEQASTAFPYVSVIAPGSDPAGGTEASSYGEQTVTVYVEFFVVADEVADVNVLGQRYAAVLYQAAASKRNYAGYVREHTPFPVSISEAFRHPKQASADMYAEADVDFIQGGRITLTLRGE
ncbi:MAG: hypothetical protein JXA21_12340 [Anaerolineae bacterium]|nr:hypothetical protein [Anaerolineae bacterium]